MSTDLTRHAGVPSSHRHSNRGRHGTVCTIVFACALAIAASPAAGHVRIKAKLRLKDPDAERVSKEPFGDIPKGPLQIVISVDQQTLHLYSDGTHIADASIATGVPDHPTPLGIFSIIEKDRYHHSNIYSGAPMPYMERITWSGVALHEGANLGHPASHGCIRMSHDFATRLWALTKLGVRVIIAHPELRPEQFADPHLFAHKAAPTAPVAAKLLKTAQTVGGDTTTDTPTPREERKDAVIVPIRGAIDPHTDAAAEAPTSILANRSEPAGAVSGAAPDPLPVPPSKPLGAAHESNAPITIFVSRKDQKVYVRQNFSPLFSAPITIEHPDQPLGTHVFTAMEYLDGHGTLRWNVVSLPAQQSKSARPPQTEMKLGKYGRAGRPNEATAQPFSDPPLPPETPQQALARIEIPQEALDQISQLIVPGSSLIVSDQGLGQETGEGTDFIVVTRDADSVVAYKARSVRRHRRRAEEFDSFARAQWHRWQQPWPPFPYQPY